jgi:hypothetical protein
VTSATRVDDGVLGVNSEFELTVRFAGRDKVLRYQITSFESPRFVTFTSSTSTLLSSDTLTFEPRANGCEMTYSAELRFQGVASVANPLLSLLFRRLGDRARDSLRAILGRPRDAA